MIKKLNLRGQKLNLKHPQVMGVLNITNDSFSDGGHWLDQDAALEHALLMAADGAAIIDIGGESTRPGAVAVSLQEELDRVIPVIEKISADIDIPISIDTSKAEIMTAAVAAGAGMINDVWALRQPGALKAAAAAKVPVCLMHMLGEPGSMQVQPRYDDVIDDISWFFAERLRAASEAGIKRKHLLLDPGFGFGKNLQHNLTLLAKLSSFESFDLPILVGISRKSMLGQLTACPVDQRLPAGLAAASIAVLQGAKIVRTHDVAATVQALKVCDAVINSN